MKLGGMIEKWNLLRSNCKIIGPKITFNDESVKSLNYCLSDWQSLHEIFFETVSTLAVVSISSADSHCIPDDFSINQSLQ